MILGVSQYQVPLIETARDLGLETYGVSIRGDYPGIPLVDVFLEADITDPDVVLDLAKKYHIDGVVSASTDLAIPSIGKVVDALGLHGISFETAQKTINKIKMKKAFLKYDVPTAAFQIASDYETAYNAAKEIAYPVMIKAVDQMGSKGITKVCHEEELRSALDRAWEASEVDEVIVEEFLEGLEFGAQALIADGRLRYVIPHNDQVSAPPYCSPIGHSFPMDLEEDLAVQLEVAVARGLEALGITHSHANIDCILTSTGVKILEIAARVGATCLPESVSILTGMNVFKQVIELALGLEPDCNITMSQPNAALYIMSHRSGTLDGYFIPDWIRQHPDISRLTMYAKPGQKVRQFRSGPDRIGEVIVKGNSAQDAEKKAKQIADSIVLNMT